MRKEDVDKEWVIDDPTVGKVRFWYSIRYANTEDMEAQLEEGKGSE